MTYIYTGYYIHAYRVSEINMPCHIVHHEGRLVAIVRSAEAGEGAEADHPWFLPGSTNEKPRDNS